MRTRQRKPKNSNNDPKYASNASPVWWKFWVIPPRFAEHGAPPPSDVGKVALVWCRHYFDARKTAMQHLQKPAEELDYKQLNNDEHLYVPAVVPRLNGSIDMADPKANLFMAPITHGDREADR